MLSPLSITVLLFLAHSGIAQQQDSLPVQLPEVAIDGTCSSAEVTEQARNSTKAEIRSILQNRVIPTLETRSACPCGGPGPWHRIANLNLSDPNQQCPSTLRSITSPARGCGRLTTALRSCDSAVFPSNGLSYSRVCGRINGFQQGGTDAFSPTIDENNPGLEHAYISGISLTHGAAGSRQHIWTFAAALWDSRPDSQSAQQNVLCPCSNVDVEWPYQVPTFVGDNYFCDTSNPGPSFTNAQFYLDDPLWDGQGCRSTSTCCEFNTPPWFCTTLPQPTTDNIELRICGFHDLTSENVFVDLVDMYVM